MIRRWLSSLAFLLFSSDTALGSDLAAVAQRCLDGDPLRRHEAAGRDESKAALEQLWQVGMDRLLLQQGGASDPDLQLIRSWLLRNEPQMAAEAVRAAIALAPESELVLRHAALNCLEMNQPFCSAVEKALRGLPSPSADALILAASLNHESGGDQHEALYSRAATAPFANAFGEHLQAVTRVMNQIVDTNSMAEHDAVGAAFGIALASPLGSASELLKNCRDDDPEQRFRADPQACLALARRQAIEADSLYTRAVGTRLYLDLAPWVGEPDELARAEQARAEFKRQQDRLATISCRASFEPRATRAFMAEVIEIGEIEATAHLAMLLEAESD